MMQDRLEQLQRFAEEHPEDPFPRYALALEHRRRGDTEAALDCFDALRRDFPEYLPQYLMHGQILEAAGRVEEARAAYEQGIALAARQGEAHAQTELEEALAALGGAPS